MERPIEDLTEYLKCGLCNYCVETTHRSNLEEHVKSAHNLMEDLNTLKCVKCLFEASTPGEVDNHMKRAHEGDKIHQSSAKEHKNIYPIIINLKVNNKNMHNNKIGQLKAKLPIVQNLADAEENLEQETQGVDSHNSDILQEEPHDNEEHVEKWNAQERCQTSCVEETMKRDKKHPMNTQNDLDQSLLNKSSDGNINQKENVMMKGEITKEQPSFNKEGEKNFKCDRCPYETTLKGHLVRHVSRHKSHFCDQCPYTATAKPKLKEHMKEAHNEHMRAYTKTDDQMKSQDLVKAICEVCGKDFGPFKKGKYRLKTHVKGVHLQIRDHKCDECGSFLSSRCNLRIHKFRIHMNKKDG